VTISAEKLLKAQRVCGVSRANESNIAQLAIDEHQPTQHKRTEKDLAQTCIARRKGANLCGPKLQNFTGLYHSGLHDGSLSSDHACLTGEHSRA
jgi:hypothetical protein